MKILFQLRRLFCFHKPGRATIGRKLTCISLVLSVFVAVAVSSQPAMVNGIVSSNRDRSPEALLKLESRSATSLVFEGDQQYSTKEASELYCTGKDGSVSRNTGGGVRSSGGCVISGGSEIGNPGSPFGDGGPITPENEWKSYGCFSGSSYMRFNVQAGMQYVWSFCSDEFTDPVYVTPNAPFDSQLTLVDDDDGSIVAFADDECGDDARIQWTATFTGVIRVRPTRDDCDPDVWGGPNECTVLGYRRLGEPTGVSQLLLPDDGATAINPNNPIVFEWESVANATEYVLTIGPNAGWSASNGVSNPIFTTVIIGQTTYSYTEGLNHADYWWTVAPKNDAGLGEFVMPSFHFDTHLYGCINPDACNYDPTATAMDDSCQPRDCVGQCDGNSTGPDVTGTSCDDGNAQTIHDTYNQWCECVGIAVGGGAPYSQVDSQSNFTIDLLQLLQLPDSRIANFNNLEARPAIGPMATFDAVIAGSSNSQHETKPELDQRDQKKDSSSGISGLRVSPNPVSSLANLSFELDTEQIVTVALYNFEGKCLRLLEDHTVGSAGPNLLSFDTKSLAPGTYLCAVKTQTSIESTKLIVF